MKYKIIVLPLFLLVFVSCNINSESQKYHLKKGEFKASITETGELKAINSKSITMPFLGWKYGWQFKIISLAEHGAKVEQGDTVIIIDPSEVIKVLENEKIRLETEEANLNKLRTRTEGELSQLEAERMSARSNYELIKLQVEKFSFEPENKQKIKKMELEISSIKIQNIDRKYEVKQTVFENELRIQQLKINQIKNNIVEANQAMQKLFITSPNNGIFQLERNQRSRNMVQLGDEVHQGQLISGIPDMSKMKVIATINETDISKLKLKQQVIIRLDAYPEKPFYGEINYIGRISRQKENDELVKVFDFEVQVRDSDQALKPGMTVSCEIITKELNNAFYIENECIFSDSSQYYLLKESAGKPMRIPVSILARNNNQSAVQGEIEEGQRYLSREELERISE